MYSFVLYGQSSAWINDIGREIEFPTNVYLVGFAEEALLPDEDAGSIKDKTRKKAQGYLTESIQISVKGNSTLRNKYKDTQQVDGKRFWEIVTEYESNIETYSSIENIAGLNTKIEEIDNKVYALAFVKREELINHNAIQISRDLQQVEIFLNSALKRVSLFACKFSV